MIRRHFTTITVEQDERSEFLAHANFQAVDHVVGPFATVDACLHAMARELGTHRYPTSIDKWGRQP